MNLDDQALRIAKATQNDADAVRQIRTEYASLALLLATSDDAGKEITSGTINGQSFSATITVSKSARLQLLDRVIHYYDNGARKTRRTTVRFL